MPEFQYSDQGGGFGLQKRIYNAEQGIAPGQQLPTQQPQGQRVTGSEIQPMNQEQYNSLNNAGQTQDLYNQPPDTYNYQDELAKGMASDRARQEAQQLPTAQPVAQQPQEVDGSTMAGKLFNFMYR